MVQLDFDALRETRATNPGRLAEVYKNRQRRELLEGDGRLMIVAADHPARGALAVNGNPTAMADRYELLTNLSIALSRPGVDGVLGTPDIIDDLALLGLLEAIAMAKAIARSAAGSVNRTPPTVET
mgnify:CR=1 FL=1